MIRDPEILQAALVGFELQKQAVRRGIAAIETAIAGLVPRKPRLSRWGTPVQSWSAADIRRLRELYRQYPAGRVAALMGRSFSSVRSKAKTLHLGKHSPWTPLELEQLRSLYPDLPTCEVAKRIGRPIHAVYRMAKTAGVRKSEKFNSSPASGRLLKGHHDGRGLAGRFPKGHVPANKGLRRPGWWRGGMIRTMFKPGQRPADWKPVGTITTAADGYQHIKVREPRPGERHPGGCGKGYAWEFLHIHVWEQEHGPVPPGHAIAFKDGDKLNCSIDNLECISRAELGRRNVMWNRYPRPLAEAIQLQGVLKRRLRRLSNAEEQDIGSQESSV